MQLLRIFFLGACASLYAQRPPVIDRELFFGDPEIAGAQLSPDGKYIAFLKPWNQTRNIWVKRADEPFDKAHLITAETKRPVPGYFWSRDSRYILFVQDVGGDENFNVYAVNLTDLPAAGSSAPPARNLTDAKGVRAMIYAVPRSTPGIIYVGLNDRDKAWHDLYEVNIASGERKLLRQNPGRIAGWVFDNKDQLRLATRSADNGDTEILRVDSGGMQNIYSCTVFETCAVMGFDKEDKHAYLITNKGAPDLIGLSLLDPRSGQTSVVESDPMKRVDISGGIVSEVTHELIATVYNDEKLRYYWKNKEWEADYRLVQKQLPGKEIGRASSTADERLWLVSAYSDTEPGEIWLFDRSTKKLTLQYRNREKLRRAYLSEMKPVRYESSDGLEIPAYLTLPKGVEAKNLPAIIVPHGGPWARDGWGYSGMPQFLANRGYAVLQPNFRGSTGYGKKFLDAGNLQWGQKMQDDVTWGAKYLVQKGIADPKRIGIMGGSYGGYTTLAGVTFTPDQYAAAVDIVGPSNLITLLEAIPPYWEQIRAMFYRRMGDPRTPEGKAQLERQSPLNSAAKIRTPLLVVQGANDPRVNKREADQIVVVLRDRGFPVEYLVAPDEGHGFARPINNLAMYAAAEKFLANHLGGRFQEEMTPEVAARLKEITVDPKTVFVAAPAAAAELPGIVAPPSPGSSTWAAKIKIGDRVMDATVSVEVKESAGTILVNHVVSSPAGESIDNVTMDKQTLVSLKREIRQGPASVKLEMKGSKVTGSIDMGGQVRPIEFDAGGPLFADGAGGRLALVCLPLADGYSTTFRNLDLQRMKSNLHQLKVVASEKVTVPAGTFDAFRVEIAATDGSADQMTLWIAKDPRKAVKMSAVMPGATISAELQ
ncbi:MAG TPA: alpha/beta fold hydrolase [Candidatus Acidoferrales bacterium]|nr:alpha/beta fold hydrolase [Candidatus Acidoferrales bacterium]